MYIKAMGVAMEGVKLEFAQMHERVQRLLCNIRRYKYYK